MDARSSASGTSTMQDRAADQARVALLQDLHRPLEEHWASTKQSGLSAMGSDYIYKHHITRLEGIYNAEEPIGVDNSTPMGPANVSPMSQLYVPSAPTSASPSASASAPACACACNR